ncbi:MAG TPA: hypothetical protein VGG40_11750 [Solirubrobacterales bacterium]|jgi:hypothetical protein
MLATRALPASLKIRFALGFGLLALALALLAAPAGHAAVPGAPPPPAVLTFRTMDVGAPGNPSVGIVPFTDAIYKSCAEAPAPKTKRSPACMEVGGVPYSYGIGELEVTVGQWVDFLNTVDPNGTNRYKLWSETESGEEWPRFGQIDRTEAAVSGEHYSVAAPEWANKPYGFANFLRTARFANALDNGKVISRTKGTVAGFPTVTYKVRLSRNTETGMYDMRKRAMTRSRKSGFVIPSQNEWIKAAYYDPNGGGKYSYWEYPTNPGAFSEENTQRPAEAILDPKTGDVTNNGSGPVAIYHELEATPAPYWCPSNQTEQACKTVNPLGLPAEKYEKAFAGSLGTVGQAGTRSPWGTLDQGGNAVEWTDTITKPPFGAKGHRVWRRLHGGISNAPVYQLWLSAVGLQPQDNTFFTKTYPWLGLRIGVIGKP